jgi:hypothetical protein
MEVMNAPNRETTCVRRERTDTPLQALLTLNDVQFVEAARHLAQKAIQKYGASDQEAVASDPLRLDFMARRLLARPLSNEELTIVKQSLAELLNYYRDHPDDAKQLIDVGDSKADPSIDPSLLAAWTMVANQLMNLDEVLNK